jgi:hypothetical protein
MRRAESTTTFVQHRRRGFNRLAPVACFVRVTVLRWLYVVDAERCSRCGLERCWSFPCPVVWPHASTWCACTSPGWLLYFLMWRAQQAAKGVRLEEPRRRRRRRMEAA